MLAGLLLATVAVVPSLGANEVELKFADQEYRVQALSPTLFRFERRGAEGFENRSTFLVTNRDGWEGASVEVVESNNSYALLKIDGGKTFMTINERNASSAAGLSDLPICKDPLVNTDANSPKRISNNPERTNKTQADCCKECDSEPDCNFWVFDPHNKVCYLLQSTMGTKTTTKDRIFGGYTKPPRDLFVSLSTGRGKAPFWTGEAPDTTSPSNPMPTPSDLLSGPKAFAVADAPRFVPPKWGATPPPPNKPLGPLANTSGFDTLNAAGDVYFFISPEGASALERHADLRAELIKLTGAIPLLEDYAFGAWFTWYHPYTQEEKKTEVERFISDGLPLDVASLDMDWRSLPENETGYEVNTTLFPDMKGFLSWVHEKKKVFFFNDHPMQVAPELSPKEIEFRYKGLTKLLDAGLDFWWFDCHWKNKIPSLTVPGSFQTLDYISWVQYIFRTTQERYNSEYRPDVKRTMTLGCSNSKIWANHHTPVWWTGDIHYDTLSQAIADEIDYGLQLKPYTHPDCTGHHGPEDDGQPYPPEVYIRWVQFCSMGNIFRTHSDPPGDRRPWRIGGQPATESTVRDFYKLRYTMIPTLVAAGERATRDGMPVVRRLDLEWPGSNESAREDQYMLADDTLVAPIDPFANGGTNKSWNRERTVWLPPNNGGGWVNAFSGDEIQGNQTITVKDIPVYQMPLYHRKGGAVVCAKPGVLSTAEIDWEDLVVEVFAPARAAAPFSARREAVVGRVASRRSVDLTVERRDAGKVSVSIGRDAAAWTVRVHLGPGETPRSVAVDGMPVAEGADGYRVFRPQSGGLASHALTGPGTRPASGSGPVVELRLEPDTSGDRRVDVLLS